MRPVPGGTDLPDGLHRDPYRVLNLRANPHAVAETPDGGRQRAGDPTIPLPCLRGGG